MKTSVVTDTIPHTIADTLSDVGHLLEQVPDAVGEGVHSGVVQGRRLFGRATDLATSPSWMPGHRTSNRNRWVTIGLVAVAVAGVLWFVRSKQNDSADGSVRDMNDRRNVA